MPSLLIHLSVLMIKSCPDQSLAPKLTSCFVIMLLLRIIIDKASNDGEIRINKLICSYYFDDANYY